MMPESTAWIEQLIRSLLRESPEKLRMVPWETKLAVAASLGLHIACCAGCGCWVGAPYCHPQEAVAENASLPDCKSPCPNGDDVDERPVPMREYEVLIRLPIPTENPDDDKTNVDRICDLLGGPGGLDGDDWDFGEARDLPSAPEGQGPPGS